MQQFRIQAVCCCLLLLVGLASGLRLPCAVVPGLGTALGLSDLDDYKPEIIRDGYIPAMGLESAVHSLGDRRPLLSTELELVYAVYPGLLQATLDGVWPSQRGGPLLERAALVAQRVQSQGKLDERDIERRMEVFRKVILGVEKYRISNPGNIASKYVAFLRDCLRTKDAWGCAAYSLEYAGLRIKDHVRPKDEERTEQVEPVPEPVLLVNSLWQQAAVRLLDLEFASGSEVREEEEDRTARQATFDQKHFSQVPLGLAGEEDVRDMLLGILRVTVRAILSRPGVKRCCVNVRESSTFALEPSFSSLRLVLGLDFELHEEVEVFQLAPASQPSSTDGDDEEEQEGIGELMHTFVVSARSSN